VNRPKHVACVEGNNTNLSCLTVLCLSIFYLMYHNGMNSTKEEKVCQTRSTYFRIQF